MKRSPGKGDSCNNMREYFSEQIQNELKECQIERICEVIKKDVIEKSGKELGICVQDLKKDNSDSSGSARECFFTIETVCFLAKMAKYNKTLKEIVSLREKIIEMRLQILSVKDFLDFHTESLERESLVVFNLYCENLYKCTRKLICYIKGKPQDDRELCKIESMDLSKYRLKNKLIEIFFEIYNPLDTNYLSEVSKRDYRYKDTRLEFSLAIDELLKESENVIEKLLSVIKESLKKTSYVIYNNFKKFEPANLHNLLGDIITAFPQNDDDLDSDDKMDTLYLFEKQYK